MRNIPLEEINYAPNSWFDEIGRVFYWKKRIFRGINKESVDKIRKLLESKLIDKLIEEKIFPKTWITDYKTEIFPLIIEHEIIDPVTYSYEWSFSMLKDSAITVLKVNKIAQDYGYQLKDCHGGNILFKKLNPLFVDLGSFVPYNDKSNSWIAFEEFIRFYYYPLKIWSKGDSFSSRRFLFSEYGFISNSTIYSFANPIYKIFGFKFFNLLIDLNFRYFRSDFSKIDVNRFNSTFKRCLIKLLIFFSVNVPILKSTFSMRKIEKKIKKLKKPIRKTFWGNYHNENYDKKGNFKTIKPRFKRLIEILNSLRDVNSVVDVAANQGFFSNLVSLNTKIKKVYSLDYDENAVDIMYKNFKNQDKSIDGVVLQNLILPITNRNNSSPNKRFNSDAVFALAVTHHLILTQKFSIEKVLETICSFSSKYVFVEFMPLGLWDGVKTPKFPEWYNLGWFRKKLSIYCDIYIEEKLEENRILFVGTLK